ncbi:proteasome-activating nucleotidase [Candidatus Woesearchaeota archaeon CG11_big_fil_rev_8_21_14_0_20_43_8]|nr:MAG: proteasome-activating nucleotidase [Candidatus Woesearchaeota archaeon CG11_big_fil_rev_8_21_14_0_20_43_8]
MTDSNSTAQKSKLDNAVFNYSTNYFHLEEENKILRETLAQMKNELDKFRRPPLMVCELKEIIGKNAVIKVPNGNEFFVEISATFDGKPGDSVLVEQKNLTVLKQIPTTKMFNVERFVIVEKPKLSWKEVGGLEEEINEIKEVIELPLKKPELFEKVGIHPPKGILLYGLPGTGKTILAKAVAASTNSTFIEVVGSELVQKFIGEGAKLVNEIFKMAKAKAPSIIFIDEVDALAAKRIDVGTSGEREVQRTFMQLLAEIDGFKALGNVKIIGCTNRIDILDPAVTRPGRLDRLIEVGLPDAAGIKEIFKIHSSRMTIDKKTKLPNIHKKMEGMSGAEIKAVVTEAGYFAIRDNRHKVVEKDFIDAIDKVRRKEEEEGKDYMNMFG